MTNLEAADHAGIFTSHAYQEQIADLGEVRMNFGQFPVAGGGGLQPGRAGGGVTGRPAVAATVGAGLVVLAAVARGSRPGVSAAA